MFLFLIVFVSLQPIGGADLAMDSYAQLEHGSDKLLKYSGSEGSHVATCYLKSEEMTDLLLLVCSITSSGSSCTNIQLAGGDVAVGQQPGLFVQDDNATDTDNTQVAGLFVPEDDVAHVPEGWIVESEEELSQTYSYFDMY
jgi:hypothetical protein